MNLFIIIIIFSFFCNCVYGQTVDDIKKKLEIKKVDDLLKDQVQDAKGFKQLVGKYYIVQVKDISTEDAEKILRHMDRLMKEFLNLYEYPFGTQKCYIVVYGLKKDYDRIARIENMEDAKGFSYRRGINNYAVTYYTADLYPTLSHEAFHLFIENIFKGDVPFWFNEGMACYYEDCTFIGDRFITNRVNKGRLAGAKNYCRSKQWPRLKNLVRYSYDGFYGCNSSINYTASWSLVYYLKNKDEKAFKGFLNDIILGKTFSTSIKTNYGMDLKKLEEDWLSYIK